jgi:pimeloyl-[acyl-carrier protein] methyl ester esterase
MDAPEGIPIILLPGMDGTGELLRALADQLSLYRPVQLIAYPPDRPLGYAQLVTYVRERVPNRPFAVLGESFSGPIAIEIAATDPRAVGLVLASSFARHPLPALFTVLTRLLDLRWLPKRIIAAALMGSTATPELTARLRRVLATLPHKVLQYRAREVLRVDKRNRLREVTCPVMCLQGRFDRLVSKRQVDEILTAQPRCHVHWFDSSHMLLATHPDAAVKAINQFCEHIDKRGSAIPGTEIHYP